MGRDLLIAMTNASIPKLRMIIAVQAIPVKALFDVVKSNRVRIPDVFAMIAVWSYAMAHASIRRLTILIVEQTIHAAAIRRAIGMRHVRLAAVYADPAISDAMANVFILIEMMIIAALMHTVKIIQRAAMVSSAIIVNAIVILVII